MEPPAAAKQDSELCGLLDTQALQSKPFDNSDKKL